MNLKNELNLHGKNKNPIMFIISYDLKQWEIFNLNNLPKNIFYSIDDKNIYKTNSTINFQKESFNSYKKKFNKIISHIKKGNTYISNLTCKTKIINNLNLKQLYNNSNAKYKLYFKNKFLSFSPETFIKISNNKIYAYPMKGTINANIKNAKKLIISNKKELAEHTMIVDLLRNDLSIIAKNINVDKFRYIDKIKAGRNSLYQVSSKISGDLDKNWQDNLGDIITSLLPAGSITGSPKKSTINIIDDVEDYNRDYFTGIWGVFDGVNVDSSVLIRFIQNENGKYFYKSGGGITIDSICQNEYDEMYEKIYIP